MCIYIYTYTHILSRENLIYIYIYSHLLLLIFYKEKREGGRLARFSQLLHARNNRRELGSPRAHASPRGKFYNRPSRRQLFKLRNYVITGGVLFASDPRACYIARLYLFHALRMFGCAPMVMPWKAAFNEYIRANYTRMSEGWVVE